ncbi:DUF58 domain-containing protein [Iocasia frigidifontis]|uniref:DUF58 domain-containing protein n=1 Tax=Iocasia fonsfrigidae TaxID=2682810 RepID=A0A8A7KDY3_9FIRM|nr:DUF58 domain-containing protein [Iocasia fonsfrigidae]QTL98315.1 DUF58 domain-containing protein [Iocasia fonsfrigidae]
MGISRRFVYLLLIGLILLIAAVFINNSFTVFLIYNVLCIILLIIDYYISPGVSCLAVERCGKEKLSLFEEEVISFQLYNKSPYKLSLELKDEVPEFHFQVEDYLMTGMISPGEKKKFNYQVVPTKRGAFTFKNLHLKYKGRLNLCTKVFQLKLNREYKVYPNMKNLHKYSLKMANNRLLKQGWRSLRMCGNGSSFESLREYVTGDDYKKINWKATGRANKPILNQYEPEKNQHVYMFIDIGRPMSYTVRGHRKLDLVVNTALVLSDVINQSGDQSAVLLFNTGIDSIVMPGKGVEHRKKIMETLYHIDYTNYTSNYQEAFCYFKKKERHRSIIFLFTDFETESEAENILQLLPLVSKNNLLIIILIKNESRELVANQNIGNLEDLFTKGVALELLNERKRIIKLLNRKGIFCLECPAEKLEYTTINKYIEVKNKMSL